MITAQKYYTKVTGVVMEIIPFAYDEDFYAADGGSVFCTSKALEDGALVIRLTPNLISTSRGGFDKKNRSRQNLRLHFAKTLPKLSRDKLIKLSEVPTLEQISRLNSTKVL